MEDGQVLENQRRVESSREASRDGCTPMLEDDVFIFRRKDIHYSVHQGMKEESSPKNNWIVRIVPGVFLKQ
jgi:hypothetical protein